MDHEGIVANVRHCVKMVVAQKNSQGDRATCYTLRTGQNVFGQLGSSVDPTASGFWYVQ